MAVVLVDGADDSWFYCSIGCLNVGCYVAISVFCFGLLIKTLCGKLEKHKIIIAAAAIQASTHNITCY